MQDARKLSGDSVLWMAPINSRPHQYAMAPINSHGVWKDKTFRKWRDRRRKDVTVYDESPGRSTGSVTNRVREFARNQILESPFAPRKKRICNFRGAKGDTYFPLNA